VQAFVSTQLAGIASWLGSMVNGLVEQMLSIIITPLAMLLYSLQIGFFWLIDCIQGIFRSMAGLDLYYYQGEEQSGDMVLSMLMSDTVMSIFYGVLVVAIMLLFVTTFVAIIRSEFVERGANPKGAIIGRSIKALFYFAAVPVVCLFGIWIANIFLKSLDEATSNQSSSLSTTVFFAASHDANRCRTDYDFAMTVKNSDIGEYLGLKGTNATQEEVALAIDTAFLQKIETPGDHTFNISGDQMFCLSLMSNVNNYYIETFDIDNFTFTYYYYDLFMGYNYLIGFMGGFIAAALLLTTCIAIIQRLFELSILFIVSPPIIAFMPIDDGKKYNQWRGEFIKRVGAMYGPIIGLNLMFMLLAVLRDINIFPNTGIYAVFNSIVQLIFLIVGLLAVKDFSALISSLIGADDALAKGEAKKEGVTKMVGRVGAGTINAARLGFQGAKALGRDAGRLGGWASQKSGLSAALQPKVDKYRQKGLDNKKYVTDKEGNVKRKLFGHANEDNKYKGTFEDLSKVYDASDENSQAGKKRISRLQNGLIGQASTIMKGQGYKTEVGNAYGGLLTSAGKGLSSHLTLKGLGETAAAGEGILGNLKLFGHDVGDGKGRTLASANALRGDKKDEKKASDDEAVREKKRDEMKNKKDFNDWASANEDKLSGKSDKEKEAEYQKFTEAKIRKETENVTGKNDELVKVEIVKDQTDDDNPNNVGLDPAIVEALKDAISKLGKAAEEVNSAGKNVATASEAMRTAGTTIETKINQVANNLPDAVYRGVKEHK